MAVVEMEGIRRFREVAIGPLDDGRRLRAGRLFRSGSLAAATEEDRRRLRALGVHTIIDLRSDGDVSGYDPPAVDPDVVVHRVQVASDPTGSHPLMAVLRTGDRERIRAAMSDQHAVTGFMTGMYRQLALDHTDAFGQVLVRLADASAGGIVVNCTAGKDRTGWAVATALLAVGAASSDVRDEYLRSNDAGTEAGGDAEMAALLAPIMGVRTEYLESATLAVSARWGSVGAYLREGLGLGDDGRQRLMASLVV